MGDLLGSLVWGAKSGQYCIIEGGSLQMVSEPLPSLRWWERAQAQWETPAGKLGSKRGWLWRPTSPGNEDVLICINVPFMTQRVLKPWWQRTYQNSVVKRVAARAIPRWVTSWEVWFGESKADNIVSLRVGRYRYHDQDTQLAELAWSPEDIWPSFIWALAGWACLEIVG
jgi:hypothetical protein